MYLKQPTVPSGPKADRSVPAPLSALPPRPSSGSTSIKGRAQAPKPGQGQPQVQGQVQGLRIKSAASAMSALSSAQEHNARLDKPPRSTTPSTPAAPTSLDSSKPAPEVPDRQQSTAAIPRDDRPMGLADRLGPSRLDGDVGNIAVAAFENLTSEPSQRRRSSGTNNNRRSAPRR